ncbi:hypothetical protein RRG08_041960 [Elysia crispata]|uniref:Uncharacterized protein n=1 Tax=Elysia crispata TaxID=231223 RepID=A0AAE0XX14_9GAST|nr:hypothetical protein RRG08_041960 [Elysia crispata]
MNYQKRQSYLVAVVDSSVYRVQVGLLVELKSETVLCCSACCLLKPCASHKVGSRCRPYQRNTVMTNLGGGESVLSTCIFSLNVHCT